MQNHELSNLKMNENWTSKTQRMSIMKVNLESKVISNRKRLRNTVVTHGMITIMESWVVVPAQLKLEVSIICTITQLMIRIAMRICVVAIKVGWMNDSAKATISAIIIYETHLLALVYRLENKMSRETGQWIVWRIKSQRMAINVFLRGGENILQT